MQKTSRLFFSLFLLFAACFVARAQSAAPSSVPVTTRAENDRDRDGLRGPVRRVRTENAKLVSHEGKLVEGARSVMETATYDMKGAKIDTAYFLSAGGALTGKEVYKYDDRGDIVEMTLYNSDGSVLSREKYDYEFDAVGNWTKMLTSVAVIEGGKMSFEPTEVTYRSIAYFLEDGVAKKLQQSTPPDASSVAANANAVNVNAANANAANANAANANGANANTNARVNAANAGASNASSKNAVSAGPTTAAQPQPKSQTGAAKQPAAPAAAALLAKSQAPEVAALNAPSAPVATGTSAPVVKGEDDLPPPARAAQAPVRPISGGVLNSKAVSLPAPLYPEIARRSQTQGQVSVEVVIDLSGRVISAKAVSGPQMLRDAAEQAAMKARFTPALLSGQPVKVAGTINYNFTF